MEPIGYVGIAIGQNSYKNEARRFVSCLIILIIMNGLISNYSSLYKDCKDYFGDDDFLEVEGNSKKEIFGAVDNKFGVYIIAQKSDEKPIYIGSAGKIKHGGKGKQGVLGRWKNIHNYNFEETSFSYEDSNGNESLPILYSNLKITVIYTDNRKIVPQALEYLLLQSFYNEFNEIPAGNKKI